MEKFIVFIHVLAGTTALFTGAWAIFTKKGRGTHSKVGLIYSYAIYITCVLGIVSATIKFNPFFIAVGVFSFYLVYSGVRALKFWQLKAQYTPTKKDHLTNTLFLLTALFMIGYPIAKMILIGQFFVSVLAVFGFILLTSVLKDFRAFKDPTQFKVRNKKWLIRHISMMGGSYISAITAFSVNNIAIEQNWIIWLAPSLIGTILIARASRKWRKKLGLTAAILVIGVVGLTAQSTMVKGKVFSSDSLFIPFVNIGVEGTAIGTVSDEMGNYTLYLPKNLAEVEVTFSHVSFSTEKVKGQSLIHLPNRYLASSAVELQMVEVTTKPRKEVVFGLSKTGTLLHTNYAISKQPSQNLGSSIGRKFDLSKGAFLKEFRFYTSSNSFDTVWLRLNFHKAELFGPGEQIKHPQVIVLITGKKKGWVSIELADYDLFFDEKVFVSLEWIKHSNEGSRLSIPISMPLPGFTHYYRYGSQDDWKVYPGMATPIQLVALVEE